MNISEPKPLGIDLGTSHTTLAAWEEPPFVLPLGEGESSIPTCLIRMGDEWHFGSPAKHVYETGEEDCLNLKRDLQTPQNTEKSKKAFEYAQEWLRYILKQAEYQLRHSSFSVAITAPYSYLNPARKNLLRAAHQTGLDKIMLVHKPLACLAGWSLRAKLNKTQNVILVSTGAEFTEAVAARIATNEVRILRSSCLPGWGGLRCDQLICTILLEKLKKTMDIDPEQITQPDYVQLMSSVERARCQLSRRVPPA